MSTMDQTGSDSGAGERVSPEQAFAHYASAVEARKERLERLLAELTPDTGLMRVLYMTYLDLGASTIDERNDPDDVREARARGWIVGRRPVLTAKGLTAWWVWKEQVYAHVRELGFQKLWRDVITW